MARLRSFVQREPQGQADSPEVVIALRFFNLLATHPFLCLVYDEEQAKFRLFTKGEPDQVRELFEIIREEECGT